LLLFVVLQDDGEHTSPTYDNIMAAYKKIASEAKAGDVVFCHYSGHGGAYSPPSVGPLGVVAQHWQKHSWTVSTDCTLLLARFQEKSKTTKTKKRMDTTKLWSP